MRHPHKRGSGERAAVLWASTIGLAHPGLLSGEGAPLLEEMVGLESVTASIAEDIKEVKHLMTTPGESFYSRLVLVEEVGNFHAFLSKKRPMSSASLAHPASSPIPRCIQVTSLRGDLRSSNGPSQYARIPPSGAELLRKVGLKLKDRKDHSKANLAAANKLPHVTHMTMVEARSMTIRLRGTSRGRDGR